jgi:hypothetical protein
MVFFCATKSGSAGRHCIFLEESEPERKTASQGTPSLRANGSRERAPDDRLREAIQNGATNWIASSQELLAMTGKRIYGFGTVLAAGWAGAAGGWPDELLKNLKKSESGRSRNRVSLLFNPFSYAVIER